MQAVIGAFVHAKRLNQVLFGILQSPGIAFQGAKQRYQTGQPGVPTIHGG